jgi:predicted Ser/Thr protein kinase
MTTIASLELQPAGMESSPNNESLYRFRKGSYVLYITLAANCRLLDDPGDYGFPPAIRRLLPPTIDTTHNHATITSSGTVTFSHQAFKGITTLWHSNTIDITTLPVVREIKANVFKVQYNGDLAIAKFARFEFEIQFIEAETAAYYSIEREDIAPKFLGHLFENGRGVGMLLEYIDGRRPAKEDLNACTSVLDQLHCLGMIHGDINRDNFVVKMRKAILLDFENCRRGTEEERKKEVEVLKNEFLNDSRRGAPGDGEDYQEGKYPIGI